LKDLLLELEAKGAGFGKIGYVTPLFPPGVQGAHTAEKSDLILH